MSNEVNTNSRYTTIHLNSKIPILEGLTMDSKQRIKELMNERGWSEYRLAIESNLSQSTVANIFNRNTTPSVSTLEAICSGFGITMAQFFASGNMVELSEEQKQMFDAWSVLTKAQKEALEHLIRVMKTQ